MVETDNKATDAAPKKAAVSKANRPTDAVKVKNITLRRINTSVDSIAPGKTGKATNAELAKWHRYLEKA